jgi:hypothetical protein
MLTSYKENMINRNILFLGHGYVAQYFCKSYHSDTRLNLAASINHSTDKYFKSSDKITTINFLELNDCVLDNYTHFVISIPPFYQRKTDVIIYEFHKYFLNRETPYKLIYLSSTSVYGDHHGKKVQEGSSLKATSSQGLARIACEKKYLELTHNPLANIFILRLAGIYGDKRSSIPAIRDKVITENKLSNRMISRTHVADIASIIRELILSINLKNQIFNVADNKPCPTNELNDYICEKLLKIAKLPIREDSKESKHSCFVRDNKIIDNTKLIEILNYEFIFPSYIEGLRQISKNLNLI